MTNYIQSKVFSDFPAYNVCQYKSSNNFNNTNPATASGKRKNTGIIISSSAALGITLAALFLTKGSNTKLHRKIMNFSSGLANKINESELSDKSRSLVDSCGIAFSKGLQKVLNIFKYSANVVAIRDTTVDKLMRKNKFTGAISQKTLDFFNRIATNEVDRCYDGVETSLRNFSAVLHDLTGSKLKANSEKLNKIISIKGEKKPLKEWLSELADETANINQTYEKGFSKTQRIARDKIRDKEFSTLPDRVRERITKEGGIFNLDKYKTYMTEDLTQETNQKLRNDIQYARKLFTNDIKHEYNGIRRSLSSISDIIKMDDKEGRKIVSDLFGSAEKFKKCSGATEAQERTKVIEQMKKSIENLENHAKNQEDYSKQTLDSLLEETEFFKKITNQTGEASKGGLQRIATILNGLTSCDEKIFTQKEYNRFQKSINSLTRKMNYATSLESDDYFIKRAELQVGSGPTDLVGLVAPVGLGAYAIGKGKDKDEKISAALTAAVPLVGSIGTYIYGTVKMFNAPKNLVFSLVSGFGLNMLGNFAVKLYKAYSEKKSITKLALDAYQKTFKMNNSSNSENNTNQVSSNNKINDTIK